MNIRAHLSRRHKKGAGTSFAWKSEKQQVLMRQLEDALHDGKMHWTSNPCPCGGSSGVTLATRDRYGLSLASVLCLRCGTLRIDPYLDNDSVSLFYREYYQAAYARAPDLESYFDAQADIAKDVSLVAFGREDALPHTCEAPPSILELGCGAGGALARFAKLGAMTFGCDLSPELINYGQTRTGMQLFAGPVLGAPWYGDEQFDLVYAIHVLEHVRDAESVLQTIAKALRPSGVAVLVVPDIYGLGTRAYHCDVQAFVHIAHVYNFSFMCLKMLGARAGLAVSRVAHYRPWGPELWLRCTKLQGPVDFQVRAVGVRHWLRLKATELRFAGNNMKRALRKACASGLKR